MSHPSITPEECFALLVEEFVGSPDITLPSSGKDFGSSALKVHNKIFAMLAGGKLVVKLPKSRVDALLAAQEGERFDPRRNGQLMKEWVSVKQTSHETWLFLAREAMAFVASKR